MNQRLEQQLHRLPELLGQHLLLTLTALGIGIAISIPLAIWASQRRGVHGPLLAVASIVQTIPSLALLALMVPLLGQIGFLPAVIALILYSMLPMLRNTVTGILGVDAALVEAARGMGMTNGQVLRKMQLPLAAPVILAGVRTSTVWVVGIATLSTPVGQKSLGNFIFQGLQTQNHVATLTGVVAAAALAILLDQLIRLLEVASARRSVRLGVVAGGALVALVGFAAWALVPRGTAAAGAPLVRVGGKTFTEQYILAETVARRLRDEGFAVGKRTGMGSTILFDALAQGNVDCYVDYSGTIWANVLKRSDSADPDTVLDEITRFLDKKYSIRCLGRLGFENAYALAMRRDRADALGISSIEDLVRHAPSLRIGGDYEFFARPEWTKVRDAYGLSFAQRVSLDSTLMYPAVKTGDVDVIAAFSSDGRILAFDLLVLEDPKQAFPPYDAILLLGQGAASDPAIVRALTPLIGAIDDEMMRRANKSVDIDREDPVTVGRRLAAQISAATVTPP